MTLTKTQQFVQDAVKPSNFNGLIKQGTIAQLRSMSPVSSDLSVVYESTDMGGGKWTPDFTDTTSVDTTGGVLVCANGVRLKRQFGGRAANVVSYGAVGDGVADDTAAIQAALDNHRVVFFPKPKWRYKVTSSLKINNYTMIYGEQCFLDQNTLNNQTVYYAGTDCLFTTTSTDPGSGVCIQMRNVSVEGNNSTNVAMTSAIQRLSVKNCLFRHFDIGIDLTAYAVSDVVETVISECYFIQCNTGIRSTSTSGKHNTDGILSNCFFSNCITGINLDTAPGWLIQGNHFYGLGVSQQHIVISGYLLKILGNYIEPANQRGIVYKMTEGNGVCNAIIADNLVMVKSGEVGITLMSLVGEADGLIVADNVINSGTGLTTGSIGVSVEGSFRVYGTLLNNDINNVETKVSTGALGSIRSGGFENNYYKFRGSNGIELSNGTRLSEYFGKPTPVQPFGSQGFVYNQAGGSVNDIGGWEYRVDLTTAWKKIVSLDRQLLDSGAMPTTGSFTAGDTIMNDTPSILTLYGVKYVIQGWKRITTGSNHVLGTDWFAMPAVDPTGIIAIQTISDLNSLSVAGWFKTTVNPTNAPAGSSPTAFFQGIQFLSNGDPNYINQLVFDTSGNEYKRTKSAGAWGSWYKVSSRLEGTTAQRNAIISPAEGQDFYNTETHAKEYWNGTVWKTLTTN